MYRPLQFARLLCLLAGVCSTVTVSYASVQNKRFTARQVPHTLIEPASVVSPTTNARFSTAAAQSPFKQGSASSPSVPVVRLSPGASQIENALQVWSLHTLNNQTHRRGRSQEEGVPVTHPEPN